MCFGGSDGKIEEGSGLGYTIDLEEINRMDGKESPYVTTLRISVQRSFL